jgi:signal transduction histidine kinase
VDSQNRIITVTSEAERALRLSPAQGQSRQIESLPAPLQAVIREAQNTGQAVAERQIVLPAVGKETAALSVMAIPLPAEKGAACMVLLKDLSARAKLEQHLRRLNRLASLGTLSTSMAHEIKNAFVAVRTFIDLLLEKNQDAELAGTVRRETDRVESLVSRMLKFAAPAPRTGGPVRLHEILDHSLRLVQHRAEGKVITFNREFQAASDWLDGDDHQLEQALVNLLLNAVEAMHSEGVLTVSTDLVAGDARSGSRGGTGPAQLLRIRITDTGMGIPAENMRRVFEPFFTTKENGTGLGLAITRRIIEEHNGDIRVESRPGKGTSFTILLPAGSQTPRQRDAAP